jgi:hypothetical protein
MPCRHDVFCVLQYSEVEIRTIDFILHHSRINTAENVTSDVTNCAVFWNFFHDFIIHESILQKMLLSAGRMLAAECYCARDKFWCLPSVFLTNTPTGEKGYSIFSTGYREKIMVSTVFMLLL